MWAPSTLRTFRLCRILALAIAAAPAAAADVNVGSLRIAHPYARPTPPGATTGAVYLRVDNNGSSIDRLVSASSPIAARAEIHDMKMDEGVMRMRSLSSVEIKPGETVALKSGGMHVMLTDLKQPLKSGSTFPMRLVFAKAGAAQVEVAVEGR
jgi:copper(I)-binding protein